MRCNRFSIVLLGSVAFALVAIACSDQSGPAVTRPEDTEPGTAAVIQPGALESYYFEASVKTASQVASNSSHLVIKGWFEAPDRTRWQLGSSNPADAHHVRQILIVDDTQWLYEPDTNTFTKSSAPATAAQLQDKPHPLHSNYQLGLVLDAMKAGERLIGTDTYLGREVEIFERTLPQMQIQTWVDREYGFTLRQLVTSTDPNLISFEANVEKVQFNPVLADEVFTFTPPPGAQDASASASTGPQETHGILNIPSGMLSPGYLPQGYRLDSSSQTAAGGLTSYIERKLVSDDGGQLVLTETYRPGGLPDHFRSGTPLTVRGAEGFTRGGQGVTTLQFYEADVIVLLQSNVLDIPELLRIAESMTIAP